MKQDLQKAHWGNKRKVVIIGLDALTWDIAEPLIAKNEMPNLKKLMDAGSYGTLESLKPMMSPVVWTSIATGKRPEKHGVVDFYSGPNAFKALPIWEVLSRAGRDIGIFAWLIPSVPKIKSFVVPGWLTVTTETFPEELSFIKELELRGKGIGRSGYMVAALKGITNGLRLSTVFQAFSLFLQIKVFKKLFLAGFYKTILMKNRIHTDFFVHLYKKYMPDFSAVVLYATDQIPHHYWKFMDPEGFAVSADERERYGDVVRRTYIESDSSLGRILDAIPNDATVFVLSDHGMGRGNPDVKYVFRTEVLLDHLALSKREAAQVQILDSNLHISIKGDRTEKEAVRDEVTAKLKDITVISDGSPLFDLSYDELGNIMATTRKISTDIGECLVRIQGKNVRFADLIETKDLLSALHTLNGVFVAKGEGIKKGQKFDGASILDMAPTILYLMGYPVAEDMDGKVLSGIVREEYLETNPCAAIKSYEEHFGIVPLEEEGALQNKEVELLKERLRDLGYLE